MSKEKVCESCAFYELRDDSLNTGECRRHAPSPSVPEVEEGVTAFATWPVVCFDEWCGDWVARHEVDC